MERRREERLAMYVLVPQFPERSALGKTRGEEGALMRKAGLEFNTSSSAVAAGSCYNQQQSQRLQELWAGHRASQSSAASGFQRSSSTNSFTCAKTVLGSGRDQYCDFHHFWT